MLETLQFTIDKKQIKRLKKIHKIVSNGSFLKITLKNNTLIEGWKRSTHLEGTSYKDGIEDCGGYLYVLVPGFESCNIDYLDIKSIEEIKDEVTIQKFESFGFIKNAKIKSPNELQLIHSK